jgi:hypothetical protein
MTYKQSRIEMMNVKWKTKKCGSNDGNCWCLTIVPAKKMICDDGEVYVVPSGSIDKKLAKHIVKLHNENL